MTGAAVNVAVDRKTWSSGFAKWLIAPARARRSRVELVAAGALYLAFACYMTWPLATNLSHSIYGGPGDPYGTITFDRELVEHHLNPFLPGTFKHFAAPSGQAVPWPRDLASAPGVLSLYLLTVLFGAIPAFGLYTLAGYALTGVMTFLLARRLTANLWAALIAGWAFAFYPFAILNGQAHPDFVQGWVIALAVWRMLELLWHPSRRNGLLTGLAVVLGMWWSPYFILLVGVTYIVVTVTALLLAWRERRLATVLVPQLIVVLILAVFAIYLGALSHVGAAEGIGIRTNSVRDLYTYAAHPLEYLIPDPASPLFGGATRSYLEAHKYAEKLYVGITVISLALVALAAMIRRRLTPTLQKAVLALSLVATAATLTSMSPKVRIFGAAVPFPSHFIAHFTTTWRVYARFGMIVMLALSLLVAVGLDVLTRTRGVGIKVGILSLATIVVPLDLWSHQSGQVYEISTPGIYRTLARQPMGLVAEYPLPLTGRGLYHDIFFNNVYDKPMINGYPEGSAAAYRASLLTHLNNPSTAPDLATIGVKYVVLDRDPSEWGLPKAGQPGSGFHLIAEEPYAALYLVTAHPRSPALPAAGEGFELRLGNNGSLGWLLQPSGTIELAGTCASCDGVFSMVVGSLAGPRHVTIFDSRGHVLAEGRVGERVTIRIPLHFTRRTTLRVTAEPGPQPVRYKSETVSASIAVGALEFTPAHQKGNGAK